VSNVKPSDIDAAPEVDSAITKPALAQLWRVIFCLLFLLRAKLLDPVLAQSKASCNVS
jgi:hypothetical protein